ncbi:sushi, von Willebrand factor type A, EGF and pentraxin domain-containing protein 1 [Trichonephila inaurata madagascariensis]|uniref:Sushi, von Willebrand factor type A, EGF and pentraxin domain-containing protein 1 n=1 Tax=Trichonephila inaurata madagascariensis TaxID=2747483 RepID=A0A8X6YNW5_9ARAC|nr:sushi, von Willebrand factor type A, EGF and pentraxin domain-containing protein 1 [Trichonephila inaurata madagascariensis]
MPKCIPKICQPPNIPEYLEIKGNCSFKKIGEHCEVICKHGGKVIGISNGKNKLKCLENLKWSSPPDCTCANPNVFDPIQLKTKCDSIPKMGKCFLRCIRGYDIAGIDYATCQNNGKWGAFPTCRKISCPEPALSNSVLKVNGECRGKLYQDACFVTCREGGQLIGEAKIKCEYTGVWSSLPQCTCPIPNSSSGLVMKNCNAKRPDEQCFVQCKNHLKLIGDAFFLEGGQLIGEAKIKCEYTGVWSSLPQCTCPVPNSSSGLVMKNCNAKRPDEHCFVQCKNHLNLIGDAFFLCQKNTKWSIMAKCIPKICPPPNMPEYLEIKGNCSFKKIGENCEVSCKHGGNVFGTSNGEIRFSCLESLKWSSPPDCACAKPNVSEPVKVLTECDFITRMEKCFLQCNSGYSFTGPYYAVCQNNGKWGAFPTCQKISCPEPALSGSILKVNGECRGKLYQDACFVTCREGGKLIGDAKINCEFTGLWSSLPNCTCPIVNAPNGILLRNCYGKRPDENCNMQCTNHMKVFGDDLLLCQKNTKWSIMVKCIPKICLPPNIPDYLEVKENCSFKKIGESCKVSCKHGGNIIGTKERCFIECKIGYTYHGPAYLVCQYNSVWNPLPSCLKISCPSPILLSSAIRILGECNGKSVEDECQISCAQGGQLLGQPFIKCLDTLQWSPFPICSCPFPDFPAHLKSTNNCFSINPGEKCDLECEKNLELVGTKSISCGNDSMWSEMPNCVNAKMYCPEPVVEYVFLKLEEKCSKKSVGEACKLGCKENSQIKGNDSIECLKNLEWSTLPECACPLPNVPDEFENLNNCSFKTVNEKCKIKCKSRNYTEILTCSENRKWTPLPYCPSDTCDVPLLPVYLSGKCGPKKVGERCMLDCRSRGNIVGYNYIQCLEGKIWSILPDCTCPVPSLDTNYDPNHNCHMKKAFDVCSIKCALTRSKFINITCQDNRMWSVPGKCSRPRLRSRGPIIRKATINIPAFALEAIKPEAKQSFLKNYEHFKQSRKRPPRP